MRAWTLGFALAAALAIAVAATASPPPTARCRDGTLSYSAHRSGTCSHHRGVAAWLGTPAVGAGATVLFAPRTRSAGCTLGAEPDRRCSPGAYAAGLAKSVLCARSFRTSTVRSVSESEKHAIEVEYGLAPRAYGHALEIDHIVPLELGGSNDPANLYPERVYQQKDRLENRLKALVCAGRIELRAAQRAIAADWQALYAKVFAPSS
ncbi:MAG: HNH endonuclease signature motif containing protein [Gaiellaceae bacterium]